MATYNPSEDTMLYSANPTTNYGNETYFGIGEHNAQTWKYHALLQFDLSGIASSKICASAVLRLYRQDDFCDNARTIYVYRCLRNWGETTATWNTYDGITSWTTAGGTGSGTDIEATDIGSLALTATESAGYKEITLTPSKVQDWWDGDLTNNGVLIWNGTDVDDLYTYNSRTGANPPQLVITLASAKRPVWFFSKMRDFYDELKHGLIPHNVLRKKYREVFI